MQNTESYHDWLEYEAWNESQMAKDAYRAACQLIFGPHAHRPDYEYNLINALMQVYFGKVDVPERHIADLCVRGLITSVNGQHACTCGGRLIAGHLMTNVRDFTFEHLGS